MTAIWMSACLVAAVAAAGLGAACALAGLRMPGRTPVAAPAMVVMAVSCADMVLPDVQLLGPLAWAGLLVGSALLALLDRRHRGPAAHHAASLLLMAVMWAAMLSAAAEPSGASAAGTDPPSSATSVGPAGAAVISVPRIGTAALAAGDPDTGTAAGTAAGTTADAEAATAPADAATGTDPGTAALAAGSGSGHAGHGAAFTDGGTLLAGLMGLVVAASVALAASAVRSARRPAGLGVAPALLRLESAQHLSMAVAMTLMAAGMFLPLAGAGAP